LSNAIKTALKIIFSLAIITWLLKSGKLDLSLISRSFSSGYSWLICFGLLIVQAFGSSIRWGLLLSLSAVKKLHVMSVAKVTWIGLFFNSFLPGAVTGDLIKLVYARDLDPTISKTYLVTSVLVDRILGLIGLLFLLGISSIYYYDEITVLSEQMKNLIHFNLLLFSGAIGFITFLLMPRRLQEKFLKLSQYIPVIGPKVFKTLKSFWTIGDNKVVLIKCILLSAVLQCIAFYGFYLISSPFYGKELPFQYIVTFIPLGFMAVAVPISPAGLGVGHAAFDKLFSLVEIQGGANFFNLFFIVLLLVNSMGFIPYILSSKKHSFKEAGDLEEELISS
jgi:hypothetical protein